MQLFRDQFALLGEQFFQMLDANSFRNETLTLADVSVPSNVEYVCPVIVRIIDKRHDSVIGEVTIASQHILTMGDLARPEWFLMYEGKDGAKKQPTRVLLGFNVSADDGREISQSNLTIQRCLFDDTRPVTIAVRPLGVRIRPIQARIHLRDISHIRAFIEG